VPDVLLVDLGLPEGRGAELIRRAAVGQQVGGEPEQLERHTGLQTPVEEAP
jgi:hypothetical protein